MRVLAIKTRVFRPGENLAEFITKAIPKIAEKSVIVVTSKIVALSENRLIRNISKVQLIKQESQEYIKTKWCYLTLKSGQWCANAGVDESNVPGGGFILLPKDSYKAAEQIRKQLKKYYKVINIGIIITDSRVLPLRAGVTGVALGYAGFAGLRNYVGRKDLFGRKLKMTQTNIADSLATAAVLLMGEGKESCPLAIVEGSMIRFRAKFRQAELRIDPKDDMYRPLFERINPRRKK